MSAPATLPLRVRVRSGESFASLVERLAAANRCGVLALLYRLGVVDRLHFKTLPTGYGIVLPETRLQTVAQVAGIEPDVLRATLVSVYDGVAVDLSGMDPLNPSTVTRVCAREWFYGAGSNVCPQCLDEQPYWQVAWKLPWTPICTRHRRLLISTCPACGARAGAGRAGGRTAPAITSVVPVPGNCHAPLPAGTAVPGRKVPCGFPLAFAETDDVSSYPTLLDAQQRINVLLDAEADTGSLMSFRRLRSLCSLLLAVASRQDLGALPPAAEEAWQAFEFDREATRTQRHRLMAEGIDGRKGPRTRYWHRVPGSAPLMAAILPSALEAGGLEAGECDQQRLVAFAESAWERIPTYAAHLPTFFSFPDDLATEWQALLRRNHKRLTGRATASFAPRAAYEPRHVPRLLQEELFDQNIRELTATLSETTARAFGSLALVRLSGVYTWREAAEVLGWEHDRGYHIANNAVSKLSASDNRDAFWRAMEGIASSYERTSGLVDYRERERRHGQFSLIPTDAWSEIYLDAGIVDDRHGARRRNASAWVWARITGLDWRSIPPFKGSAGDNARHRYRLFLDAVLPAIKPALITYQCRMIEGDLRRSSETRSQQPSI